MTLFSYKAVDQWGKSASGRMDARNELDLESRLLRLGLDLIQFQPAKDNKIFFSRNRVRLHELAMFCYQLEQLTLCGMPLLDSLGQIIESSSNLYFQQILTFVIFEMENGKTLSQALSDYPQVFNMVFVNMVAAGEASGQLTEVWHHLYINLRWQHELQSTVKKLLAYPLFVLIVILAVLVFLMTYLVPQMVPFLSALGHTLPPSTRLLISLSDYVTHYGWLLLMLALMLTVILTVLFKRSEKVRFKVDQSLLKFPLVGTLVETFILARLTRYLGLMYQAGIPVLQAIKICEAIMPHRVFSQALQQIHVSITEGIGLADSFMRTTVFPHLVLRMIRLGESTGGLDKTLLNLSDFYDRELNEAVQKWLSLLEPFMTLFLGSILAFIMLALLGPVYDAFGSMGF